MGKMMKTPRQVKFAAGLAAALVVPLVAASAQAAEIQELVSPGGITFWYVQEPSLPIIAVRLAFENAGNSTLPAGKEGLGNMISVLLDEGAGDLPSLEFQRQLEKMAIRLRFNDNSDTFRVNMRTVTANREDAFQLMGLALSQPRFDPDPVDRMRQGLISDLNRRVNDPDYLLARAWMDAAYPDHPYGQPSRGTLETVESFTVADLRDFVATRFTLDRLVVGAVGDIDPGEMGRLLDGALGGLPATGPLFDVADVDPTPGEILNILREDIPQSSVLFGTKGIAREDPDYYAAALMNTVLGGAAFISRLWTAVREERGLAYSVGTSLSPLEHTAFFSGSVATRNDQVEEALGLIVDEFQRMATEGISEQELADAKTYTIGNFALSLDTNSSLAQVLVGLQISGLGATYIDDRAGFMNAVTTDDILRVARRVFWGDGDATEGEIKLITSIVGNPAGFDDKED